MISWYYYVREIDIQKWGMGYNKEKPHHRIIRINSTVCKKDKALLGERGKIWLLWKQHACQHYEWVCKRSEFCSTSNVPVIYGNSKLGLGTNDCKRLEVEDILHFAHTRVLSKRWKKCTMWVHWGHMHLGNWYVFRNQNFQSYCKEKRSLSKLDWEVEVKEVCADCTSITPFLEVGIFEDIIFALVCTRWIFWGHPLHIIYFEAIMLFRTNSLCMSLLFIWLLGRVRYWLDTCFDSQVDRVICLMLETPVFEGACNPVREKKSKIQLKTA